MALPSLSSSPKRVLLIRLSAFGDVVIATGLLQGLKRAYPDAEIDWLVQPEFAELLRTQDSIAKVIVWPRKDWRALWRNFRWIALWRAIGAFTTALRARDYDWVIDAQGLFKSRALARLAGGRTRIGYDGKEPGRFWLHRVVTRFPEARPERRHIGDEHGPMLQVLTGASDPVPQLRLPGAPATVPYLVVAPFTTRPQKHWPQTHWVTLLRVLAAQGRRVVILGGPADAASAAAIAREVQSPLLDDRTGQTSLVAAAQLIAGATAIIGVDTGLTHLGFALGRPTIALFGSTRPYAAARPGSGAVLFSDLACAPCGRHPTCNGHFDCLAQLSPAAVQRQLATLIA